MIPVVSTEEQCVGMFYSYRIREIDTGKGNTYFEATPITTDGQIVALGTRTADTKEELLAILKQDVEKHIANQKSREIR